MKVLIAGAGGMLARDVATCISEHEHDTVSLPHNRLDITDFKAVKTAVDVFEPELVINCAAYTRVDEAEKDEHRALLVNGFGVQNICLACQQRDIPLVHFSTDYIFDGAKESAYTIYDEPNPLSAYGRSKLLGERYIKWLLSRFYIVRTSWLFGLNGKNFIETMLKLGQRQEQVSVVKDQRGCPTWSYQLAQAVVELIETERYGIYHITNSEPTTWYDFAREIFRLCGRDIEVIPVTSDQFPRPAVRPQNSVLDLFPIPQILGREMPSWREALKEYLIRRGEWK